MKSIKTLGRQTFAVLALSSLAMAVSAAVSPEEAATRKSVV